MKTLRLRLTVVWQRPDNPNPIPLNGLQASVEPYLIPSAYLSAYRTLGSVAITSNLSSGVTVTEGQPLTLSVGGLGVDGSPPCSYQWYRNGVALDGGNSHSYSVARAPVAESGAAHHLIVSNSFSSATSTVATINVTPDVTSPTVAFRLAPKLNQTPTTLQLVFSEPVDKVSAETPANYVIMEATASIQLSGVTGYAYDVQRATNLTLPILWTTVTTSPLSPAPDGSFAFTDTNAPPGTVFYRTLELP